MGARGGGKCSSALANCWHTSITNLVVTQWWQMLQFFPLKTEAFIFIFSLLTSKFPVDQTKPMGLIQLAKPPDYAFHCCTYRGCFFGVFLQLWLPHFLVLHHLLSTRYCLWIFYWSLNIWFWILSSSTFLNLSVKFPSPLMTNTESWDLTSHFYSFSCHILWLQQAFSILEVQTVRTLPGRIRKHWYSVICPWSLPEFFLDFSHYLKELGGYDHRC